MLGADLLVEEDFHVVDLLAMKPKQLKKYLPNSKTRNRLKNWLLMNEDKIRAADSTVVGSHTIPQQCYDLCLVSVYLCIFFVGS